MELGNCNNRLNSTIFPGEYRHYRLPNKVWTVVVFVLVFYYGLGSTFASEPDSGWLATVQKKIAQKEYEVGNNGKGLQAPNRAHNIRTYFDEKGIHVVDRTADGNPELLRLTLAGFGRGRLCRAVCR